MITLPTLPVLAYKYLPMLWAATIAIWVDYHDPAIFAAIIEQETCYGLKDKRCWNPKTELKTSREYGFGLGQTTIAYRSDGSERMNVFKDLKKRYKKELNNWTWNNRFNAEMQIRSILLLNKENWNRFTSYNSIEDRQSFMLAAYNGGAGSVIKDIGLCRSSKNCNPKVWFGNVETHSFKSKKVMKGYGRSPYAINREYVRSAQRDRIQKYRPHLEILQDEYLECKKSKITR